MPWTQLQLQFELRQLYFQKILPPTHPEEQLHAPKYSILVKSKVVYSNKQTTKNAFHLTPINKVYLSSPIQTYLDQVGIYIQTKLLGLKKKLSLNFAQFLAFQLSYAELGSTQPRLVSNLFTKSEIIFKISFVHCTMCCFDKPKVVSRRQSQKMTTWFSLKSQCPTTHPPPTPQISSFNFKFRLQVSI